MITKEFCQDFRKDFDAAVKAVAEKHGLTFSSANISFYPEQGLMKMGALQFAKKIGGEEFEPRYVTQLMKVGRRYGLTMDHLGKKIHPIVNDTFVGMHSQKAVIKKENGKLVTMDAAVTAKMLGVKMDPAKYAMALQDFGA